MIGLSDSQLEIILGMAEPMPDDRCQEFLERVAVGLRGRIQISDNDVSVAVRQALRVLVHNSDAWKEWWRQKSSPIQSGVAV
jgi:hypothetical protein